MRSGILPGPTIHLKREWFRQQQLNNHFRQRSAQTSDCRRKFLQTRMPRNQPRAFHRKFASRPLTVPVRPSGFYTYFADKRMQVLRADSRLKVCRPRFGGAGSARSASRNSQVVASARFASRSRSAGRGRRSRRGRFPHADDYDERINARRLRWNGFRADGDGIRSMVDILASAFDSRASGVIKRVRPD